MQRKLEREAFYTDDELKKIKEDWLAIKEEIDAKEHLGYYVDKDAEYARHLANKGLQKLFGHAAHLYHSMITGDELHLYPTEPKIISESYRKVIADGYYSRSKTDEKERRNWLAKIVLRQTYRRYKKR